MTVKDSVEGEKHIKIYYHNKCWAFDIIYNHVKEINSSSYPIVLKKFENDENPNKIASVVFIFPDGYGKAYD